MKKIIMRYNNYINTCVFSSIRAFSIKSLFNERLTISFNNDLELFSKKDIFAKKTLSHIYKGKPSVNLKSLQEDKFFSDLWTSKKIKAYKLEIAQYCSTALEFDLYVNENARTRTEFSHMQRQIILVVPFEGQKTKKKAACISSRVFTYIVNPKKISQYKELSTAKKLLILAKQIYRYGMSIDLENDKYTEKDIYVPVSRAHIKNWANMKLRRKSKNISKSNDQLLNVESDSDSDSDSESDSELTKKKTRKAPVRKQPGKLKGKTKLNEQLEDEESLIIEKIPKKKKVNKVLVSDDVSISKKKSKKKLTSDIESDIESDLESDLEVEKSFEDEEFDSTKKKLKNKKKVQSSKVSDKTILKSKKSSKLKTEESPNKKKSSIKVENQIKKKEVKSRKKK